MSPGEIKPIQHLVPPPYSRTAYRLRWRKYVSCWAITIRACANGGDTRAKFMVAALGSLWFPSLPPSCRKLQEKFVESGKPVLDSSQVEYNKDCLSAVKRIINIVANKLATDTMKRLARLSKEATTCVRRGNESISTYIERFVLLAQSYLTLTNADRSSPESHNLAMVLLTNANLPQQMFSSVIAAWKLRPNARKHKETSNSFFPNKESMI